MKTLFKLYLLGQLIALPFMLGAIGQVFSSDEVNPSEVPAGITLEQYQHDLLCESVDGTVHNSVQDEIQQLRFISDDLYGEDLTTADCPTPRATSSR